MVDLHTESVFRFSSEEERKQYIQDKMDALLASLLEQENPALAADTHENSTHL
jgi:hypothetical protein